MKIRARTVIAAPVKRPSESGLTLIEILFFVFAIGIIFPAILGLLAQKQKIDRAELTQERLANANEALVAYYERTGSYPCPAPLNAALDTTNFGKSPTAGCETASAGLEITTGRRGFKIVTGTIPVRTLGLSDDDMVDGWNKRLLYAVTANYTKTNLEPLEKEGAITVVDGDRGANGKGAGNSATSEEGNVIHAVVSFGEEKRGAHDLLGNLIEACGASSDLAGENCNFDAVLRHSAAKSDGDSKNSYNNQIRYASSCINKYAPPTHYSIVLDSSNSMALPTKTKDNPTGCAPGMSASVYVGGCSRIDVAQWALRRALAARKVQLDVTKLEGTTAFTGFTSANYSTSTVDKAYNAMGVVELQKLGPNGEQPTMTAAEEAEARLSAFCPKGNTPLGIHSLAMIKKMNDIQVEHSPGKTPEQVKGETKVITLITDGENTTGNIEQIPALKQILKDNPDTKIMVIDVGDNEELATLPEQLPKNSKDRYTYEKTQNPAALIAKLYESIGLCEELEIPEPTDNRLCGPPGTTQPGGTP